MGKQNNHQLWLHSKGSSNRKPCPHCQRKRHGCDQIGPASVDRHPLYTLWTWGLRQTEATLWHAFVQPLCKAAIVLRLRTLIYYEKRPCDIQTSHNTPAGSY